MYLPCISEYIFTLTCIYRRLAFAPSCPDGKMNPTLLCTIQTVSLPIYNKQQIYSCTLIFPLFSSNTYFIRSSFETMHHISTQWTGNHLIQILGTLKCKVYLIGGDLGRFKFVGDGLWSPMQFLLYSASIFFF